MRKPISRVRSATTLEATPKIPTAARISASTANVPSSVSTILEFVDD
jgi:hypothetical protein